MCANAFANQALLRDTLGFTGVMGSDCGAVGYLLAPGPGHNTTNSTTEMISLAVNNGTVDIACDSNFPKYLAPALAAGAVSPARLALAVDRVLDLFFDLGLLDPPSAFDSWGAERVDSPAHRALALEAAAQSIVLLKNDKLPVGPNGADAPVLPLPATAGLRFAFIGPNCNATQTLVGNYAGLNTLVESHSLLDAVNARAGPEQSIVYAPGCADTECNSTALFSDAVSAADAADVVILCIGLSPVNKYGNFDGHQEGEALDRMTLTLPGNQSALVAAIVATNVPAAAIVITGGAVALGASAAGLVSIVHSIYGGELGGDALAALLFGDTSPSGRLPYTIYDAEFVNTRPPTDMSMDGGLGITYMNYKGTPEYQFGEGMSFTTFNYTWLDAATAAPTRIDTTAFASGGNMSYAVTVTNTGTVTSDVSALAFVTSDAGAPLKKLFDFARAAALAPGASATLYFSLTPNAAATVDADGSRVLRAGARRIVIGDVLPAGVSDVGRVLRVTLYVDGADVELEAAPRL